MIDIENQQNVSMQLTRMNEKYNTFVQIFLMQLVNYTLYNPTTVVWTYLYVYNLIFYMLCV